MIARGHAPSAFALPSQVDGADPEPVPTLLLPLRPFHVGGALRPDSSRPPLAATKRLTTRSLAGGSLIESGQNRMFFATVISLWPGLIFLGAAVLLGTVIFLRTHRLIVSSLVASAIVITLCILFRPVLPSGFRYYVKDLMLEPLVRDWFQHPGESITSAAVHFVLPYAILVGFQRLFRNRAKAAPFPSPVHTRANEP